MAMIKELCCRFQQCVGTFTIFLVEASSEMGLFRHLSDYVFGVLHFGNAKAVSVISTQVTWQWSINMIKGLWCRFKQCLGICPILFLEGSSETGLFRHLSDYVFRVRNFKNKKSMRLMIFLKMFQISSRFQKCSKKLKKKFLLLR